MAGRSGDGGHSRRRTGLLEALQDAGFADEPPRPRTWRELLAGVVVCDEITPMFAEPLVLDWLCDYGGDTPEVLDAPPA